MADGPDVRALKYFLGGGAWGYSRPVGCIGCPFSRPYLIAGGRVTCDLLGGPEPVNHERPPCDAGQWRERARAEMAALLAVRADADAELARLRAIFSQDFCADNRVADLAREQGRSELLAEAARAVCPGCAAGLPVAWDDHHGVWFHPLPDAWHTVSRCKADAIRRMAEDGR